LETFAEKVLKGLIEIDTRQNAACERPAAECLREELSLPGTNVNLFLEERQKDRTNFVASIPGETKKAVLLLAHLDTANADREAWRYDPLKATVENGCIFGRGALDCKGLCAVWAAIVKAIATQKISPHKTLIFAAVADEESGGELGAKWLLHSTRHFEDVEFVVGEGGGYPLKAEEKLFYTLQTGERYEAPLEKIDREPEGDGTSVVLRGMDAGYYNPDTLWYFQHGADGRGRNIPKKYFSHPLVEKNGAWLLPFADKNAPRRKIPSTLFGALQSSVDESEQPGKLLPFISPGKSDNRFFREREIPVVGFFPLDSSNRISGIHHVDEYISRRSLRLATDILSRAVFRILYGANFRVNSDGGVTL
jgi:acetylornithine deacetylase/succinyl-diaminopimelate desuccinylase-like protein